MWESFGSPIFLCVLGGVWDSGGCIVKLIRDKEEAYG